MKISKETIKYFADKNIVVKYYPDATYEDFQKRIYDKEVKRYFDYYKDHVAGCDAVTSGYCNVLFQSNEELMDKAIRHARNNVYGQGYCMELRPYENTTLYVEYDEGDNHRIICQKVNVKSKEITVEYVEKLIAKDKKQYSGIFGNFADAMNKLLMAAGYSRRGFWVYPTTYGIGVWLFYNWTARQDIAEIENVLKANNVEYYNEYSDKMWVYRFKISKKQANIKLALSA